ncbi:hypothetical protein KAX02_13715 [candidate division WOR-3 bacterium]|nr:hypothetical protein [candidate division WOR-3 bacterium]
MITEKEKQEIIDKAVEKALLLLPEAVGSLMVNQAVLHKLNREFYTKYPEFNKQREAVSSVIELVEGRNPLMKYEDILREAVPEIKRRIKTLGTLDMNNVSKKPNRSFEKLDAPSDKPHGEL